MSTANGPIKFLDLRRQLAELGPDLEAAAVECIRSGWYLLGESTRSFESEFAQWLDVDHARACANGTDAVTLSLMALGVGPGDEVITVPNTAFATATAIARTGAHCEFADIDPDSWLIDPRAVADKLSDRTKAIVPVHLFGQAADIDAIRAVAGSIPIVEDCAQAHGTRLGGKKVGTLTEIASFSFYPSKNLGSLGDAGAVVTRDEELAERVRALRFYGQHSKDVHEEAGMNSRIDEIQAATLRVSLKHLDTWLQRRRDIAAHYERALEGSSVGLPRPCAGSEPSYHLFVLSPEDREAFRAQMEEANIETAIHYPTPIHLQPAFHDASAARGSLPHAEQLATKIVSIPIAPHLDDEEVERVCAALTKYAARSQ